LFIIKPIADKIKIIRLMNIFKDNNKKIIEIIEKVMPAVVSITVSKKNNKEKNKAFISGGSGFIVKKDGIILTNRHVMADPKAEYSVILGSGKKFKAKLLARDPIDDIAVLKIDPEGEDLPVIPLSNSREIKLGESVLAFGNVLGLFRNTVSAGIISGLARSITAQISEGLEPSEIRGLIQTDAAINPGNSGGPLVDLSGKVIGINIATIVGLENVGFAMPIEVVERDLSEIKKYGRIRRPLLGVRYISIDSEVSDKLNLPVNHGSLIIRDDSFGEAVVKNSPAHQAGIKEKDIIVEWNGEKITPEKNLQDYLSESEVGDKVTMKILRSKKEIETTVVLTERI
jgi:serine protease Do